MATKGFIFPENRRKLTLNVIEDFFIYKKRTKDMSEAEFDEWINTVSAIETNDTDYPRKIDKTKAIKDAFIEKYYPALDENSKTPFADKLKALK